MKKQRGGDVVEVVAEVRSLFDHYMSFYEHRDGEVEIHADDGGSQTTLFLSRVQADSMVDDLVAWRARRA